MDIQYPRILYNLPLPTQTPPPSLRTPLQQPTARPCYASPASSATTCPSACASNPASTPTPLRMRPTPSPVTASSSRALFTSSIPANPSAFTLSASPVACSACASRARGMTCTCSSVRSTLYDRLNDDDDDGEDEDGGDGDGDAGGARRRVWIARSSAPRKALASAGSSASGAADCSPGGRRTTWFAYGRVARLKGRSAKNDMTYGQTACGVARSRRRKRTWSIDRRRAREPLDGRAVRAVLEREQLDVLVGLARTALVATYMRSHW